MKNLQGIRFSDSSSMVHHLLSADNSMFICRVAEDEALTLMKILDSCSLVTGQKLNVEKSAVTFGAKVQMEMKEKIKRITSIQKEGDTWNYLGLP